MRIDKWLWAARFFKTRALAIKACELSRVTSNGQSTKPSKDVRLGDQLQIIPNHACGCVHLHDGVLAVRDGARVPIAGVRGVIAIGV